VESGVKKRKPPPRKYAVNYDTEDDFTGEGPSIELDDDPDGLKLSEAKKEIVNHHRRKLKEFRAKVMERIAKIQALRKEDFR
jgi:hypothetical protein